MTLRIGKLILEISYPLTAVMTAIIILDTSLSVMVCFAAAIMHEAGHIFMLCRYNAMPKRIKLTLFDIAIIDNKKYSRSYTQELAVVLAGVFVNFISAAIFYLLYVSFKNQIFIMLFSANLGLGIFNILPVDNLDGGQALLILLCKFFSPQTAHTVLDIISFVVLIPTACLGFILLIESRYNFTLLVTAIYLVALILLKHTKH